MDAKTKVANMLHSTMQMVDKRTSNINKELNKIRNEFMMNLTQSQN